MWCLDGVASPPPKGLGAVVLIGQCEMHLVLICLITVRMHLEHCCTASICSRSMHSRTPEMHVFLLSQHRSVSQRMLCQAPSQSLRRSPFLHVRREAAHASLRFRATRAAASQPCKHITCFLLPALQILGVMHGIHAVAVFFGLVSPLLYDASRTARKAHTIIFLNSLNLAVACR